MHVKSFAHHGQAACNDRLSCLVRLVHVQGLVLRVVLRMAVRGDHFLKNCAELTI